VNARRMSDEMQDWLLRPLPFEDAESRHMHQGVPFGLQNSKWEEMRSILLSDFKVQLWSFCSPPETWTTFPLRGMEGYALVKDGTIIDFVLVAIS
jgi:hypothetical protein